MPTQNGIRFETPSVYCLARPNFEYSEFLRFLKDVNVEWRRDAKASNGEELVEVSGRICYMSFGAQQSKRDNGEYIANLLRQGHESVLEHASWTLLITGVSRSFTHQLVRHRAGFSYSQLSQQYHEERNLSVIVPSEISNNPELLAEWEDVVVRSHRVYNDSLDQLEAMGDTPKEVPVREELRKVRSASRSILTEATATKIVLSANARSLRHLFTVRGGIIGDQEMRRVTSLLFEIVRRDAPNLFQDFDLQSLDDGSPIIVKLSGITQ